MGKSSNRYTPLAPTRNKMIYKTACSNGPNSGSGKPSQNRLRSKGCRKSAVHRSAVRSNASSKFLKNYAGGRVRQPRTPNTSAERKFQRRAKWRLMTSDGGQKMGSLLWFMKWCLTLRLGSWQEFFLRTVFGNAFKSSTDTVIPCGKCFFEFCVIPWKCFTCHSASPCDQAAATVGCRIFSQAWCLLGCHWQSEQWVQSYLMSMASVSKCGDQAKANWPPSTKKLMSMASIGSSEINVVYCRLRYF